MNHKPTSLSPALHRPAVPVRAPAYGPPPVCDHTCPVLAWSGLVLPAWARLPELTAPRALLAPAPAPVPAPAPGVPALQVVGGAISTEYQGLCPFETPLLVPSTMVGWVGRLRGALVVVVVVGRLLSCSGWRWLGSGCQDCAAVSPGKGLHACTHVCA